jgi:hypothetical protein
MPESVSNEDLARENPEHPTKAYDQKHGVYRGTPIPVTDTAVNATTLAEPKTPFKNLRGNGQGE